MGYKQLKDGNGGKEAMSMKIRVGWKEYEIVYKDIVICPDGVSKCYGNYSDEKQVIEICTAYSLAQQKATLLHELLHAIDAYHSLELTEETISALTNALAELEVNNPGLMGKIFKGNHGKKEA